MKYLIICALAISCSNHKKEIEEFEKMEIIYENIDFSINLNIFYIESYDSKLKDTIKINKTDKDEFIKAFFKNNLDTIKNDIKVINSDGMAIVPDTSKRYYKIKKEGREFSIYISGIAKRDKVNPLGQNILKFDSIVVEILNRYNKFKQFKIEIEKNDDRIWL